MSDCVGKTKEFLVKYGVDPSCVEMHSLVDAFLDAMERGLAGDSTSSLKMIPTYTETIHILPKGEPVIVLDAGGTNFRTCVVEFDQSGKAQISDFRKVPMPGVKHQVSASQFFSIMADEVERLIDKSDRIGFCFSYAADITAEHDGVPIVFSKEIKAPEVIGMPVGASLLAELARRGHDVSKKRIAVLNDTVATLLAGQSAANDIPYGGYIGFILGTGTNTAYVERNANIKKLGLSDTGSQIINIESGNFDFCPSRLDRQFFDSTEHPALYHLEKMISGAYLGPLCSLVIDKAIEEGVLSKGFAEHFKAVGGQVNTTVMSNYLEMPFNTNYELVRCVGESDDDALALWLIIDSVIARAAKLTAANLGATVLKSGMGTDPRRPVCINADGTTYYKTENLRKYTEYYLHCYLERELHRYCRFVRIDDSPTIGAAIAGLSI